MREIPVEAHAVCSDGQAGWVTDVVLDPVGHTITHLVVRQDRAAAREYLVPIERVVRSSRSEVVFQCSRAELAQFPEFTTTRYVPASAPEAQPVVAAWEMQSWAYYHSYEPIYTPVVQPDELVPVDEHHVPAGKLAFERGTLVQSSDDQFVGEVVAFLSGPDDRAISHFVLRLDQSGPAREVSLPLSEVDLTASGVVRLRLSQAQLEQLPAVPPGGRFNASDADGDGLRLISIIYETQDDADAAMRLLKDSKIKAQAAVVQKALDGKLHVRERGGISTRRGAVGGAVLGAVVAVVGGPIGMGLLAASTLGAAGGAIVGHADRGVPDRYARDLGRAMRAGSSALVVVLPLREEAAVLERLAPLNGSILRLELTEEMIARLTASS